MAVLKRWPAAEGVDDLFVSQLRPARGLGPAARRPDRAAAEDLVHDTFLRVALRHPDAREIRDVDGYLVRHDAERAPVAGPAAQRPAAQKWSRWPTTSRSRPACWRPARKQNRQAAYEELTLIARYACLRKATSKAASALILRFFHGYYPTEIARVLHATEPAVDVRLRIARAEARAFVAAPDRIRAIAESRIASARPFERRAAGTSISS